MATLKQMLEMRVWDATAQKWIDSIPETVAQAVKTSDGSNVETKLAAIPAQITGAVNTAVAELKGGVATDGDTLAKLHAAIEAIKALLNSDETDLDTVQEIVDYIKANRDDLTLMGANKVNLSDIINALDTVDTIEGKALDARQGKALKDLIDTLEDTVTTLSGTVSGIGSDVTELQSDVTELRQGLAAAVKPIFSETEPTPPVDGLIWYKPVGTIEVA